MSANSNNFYIDCVWFKEKGTIRTQERLLSISENTLFVSTGVQGYYGKNYQHFGIPLQKLEVFQHWVSKMFPDESLFFAQSGCECFKTLNLDTQTLQLDPPLRSKNIQAISKNFRFWRFFLALSGSFKGFGQFFPRVRKRLKEEHAVQFLKDFLTIFACMPQLMRRDQLQGPKEFKRLNRYLKKRVRQSIKQYIMQSRFAQAQELLTRTQMPLLDVAHRCGFVTQAYFSMKFKSAYGITPKIWRRLFQIFSPNENQLNPSDDLMENVNGYLSTYNANA